MISILLLAAMLVVNRSIVMIDDVVTTGASGGTSNDQNSILPQRHLIQIRGGRHSEEDADADGDDYVEYEYVDDDEADDGVVYEDVIVDDLYDEVEQNVYQNLATLELEENKRIRDYQNSGASGSLQPDFDDFLNQDDARTHEEEPTEDMIENVDHSLDTDLDDYIQTNEFVDVVKDDLNGDKENDASLDDNIQNVDIEKEITKEEPDFDKAFEQEYTNKDNSTSILISEQNITTADENATHVLPPWFTLSHYMQPNSIPYELIAGFLISILFCLLLASCYNFLYYCCLIRCGCPDDRVKMSLLHHQSRKRRRIAIPNHRPPRPGGFQFCGWTCCRCCLGEGGHDGRGLFAPLSTAGNEDYNDTDDHSSSSSLSCDSALSLEYGDDHLHDEYGEVTNRLNDKKIEIDAKNFFDKQGTASADQKLPAYSRKGKRGGSRASRKSRGSRRSRKSGKSSTRSQASSILSSSSESIESYSSSEGDDELEMEDAMMDLKLVERNMADNPDIS